MEETKINGHRTSYELKELVDDKGNRIASFKVTANGVVEEIKIDHRFVYQDIEAFNQITLKSESAEYTSYFDKVSIRRLIEVLLEIEKFAR